MASVLNLNPGTGNRFVVNLVSNPTDPLVPGTSYGPLVIAQVAGIGNIQLNGATANGVIDPSNYTITGVGISSSVLSVNGNLLQVMFVPVPEPATVLAVVAMTSPPLVIETLPSLLDLAYRP